ncbi:cyclin-dependent kinase 4 inhibitor B [Denticeps clupeoides]|uniref:Uncharacterized protein n=1 Tax=Denticeps clupeoides TaxID=299321 RepID=A0AAY3ZXU5_9TELE|nr:cyclin-dependent kinase 4 inhibitor B-like [Denticeps clupeoides]
MSLAAGRMRPEDELTSAAATGDARRVQSLLQSGADPNRVNKFGRTPLQVMMAGSAAVALLLLQHGGDPNLPDRSTGDTPLHDAARGGFLDTVRALVEFHADPRITDNRGRRPLDVAERAGHDEVAAFLRPRSG